MRNKTLYLIDGSGQFHRAYFAIRSLTTRSGLPTNAVYGFTSMLRRLLKEQAPEWIGVAFDMAGPTFRHEQYAEYKAHRPKMDEDLAVQIPYVHRVCEAFRIPILETPGFEADDVIATVADQAVAQGIHVIVVSSDKDLLQLVDDRSLQVLSPGREGAVPVLFDTRLVEEKHGVPPQHIVDWLALVGDASDNVPGVKGIGEKGARELVREFGTLEEILKHAESIKKTAYRDGLIGNRDAALLSKRLVTLRRDAPVSLDLTAMQLKEPDRRAAYALFHELEFAALAREFAPEPTTLQSELSEVSTEDALAALVERMQREPRCALALAMSATGERRHEAPIALGLAFEPGQSYVIPLERIDALSTAHVMNVMGPILGSERISKIFHDSKVAQRVLTRCGVRIANVTFDLLLAAYLLDPGRRGGTVSELALEILGKKPIDAPDAAQKAAYLADVALRLEDKLSQRLEAEGLTRLYREVELPLAALLARMEQDGVKLDVALLSSMSQEMAKQLQNLTERIYALAGERFNINSPAQLREMLFGRLGLRTGKRTAKTRAASTSEDVLEELARTHALPRLILEYRSVQKLKSTYVDSLPGLVDPQTGRIHATLNQTVTSTGRLSSSEPNLQNIPIRTEAGRRIREAFVAEEGCVLLSADYSQIELRILAHLSQDARLIEAFRKGEDIHSHTAREIFGQMSFMPVEEQRRRAKMVNYALLYGKTAFTLAKDLGVSRSEADSFIGAYFRRYPDVRRYIDETLRYARETGQVKTIMGRIRRLPELRARNAQVRQEAERQAINLPIQGSAADLIKKAMLDLDHELNRRGSCARLVLQIHDELLLEVPQEEAHHLVPVVREVMEGALKLDVPLVVDAHIGRHWAEAH